MNLRVILILLLSSLAALFVAQNAAPVEIGFLVWRASVSSALLIFLCLISGFILGWTMHAYLLHRRSRADRGELVYLS